MQPFFKSGSSAESLFLNQLFQKDTKFTEVLHGLEGKGQTRPKRTEFNNPKVNFVYQKLLTLGDLSAHTAAHGCLIPMESRYANSSI